MGASDLIQDLLRLVQPLEEEALAAVVDLVKQAIAHPSGVELAAKRAAEALAAEAAIRS